MNPPTAVTSLPSELTVEPVDRVRWPADPGGYVPSTYIRVVLDLAKGRLAMLADPDYRGPVKESRELQPVPGSFVHHWDFPTPVPSRIAWLVRDHLDPEQATRLLALIAQQAEVILTELVPVPERAAGGYDWSLRAAAAVRIIDSFTSNWWHALSETSVVNAAWTIEHYTKFEGLLDMDDALDAVPELADPEWAVMPDAELDEAAAKLARLAPYSPRDRWLDAAHLADHSMPKNVPVYFVGVLRTLYRLRQEQAGALTAYDASHWFSQRLTHLAGVTDDTPDAELARLAEAEDRAAASDGKRLLGALPYLQAVRQEHRNRIRLELTATGQRAADMASHYQRVRSTRAALLLRVDSWNDPDDGDDTNRNATLARMAGISRQAVLALRERAHAVNIASGADQD